MKLFTVGPVEMYQDSLEEGGRQLPYFRTSEFSDMMLETEKTFLSLLNAPEGTRICMLTASGTGGMEAAVVNVLRPEDKVLIINGGGFGARFVEICSRYGIEYDEIKIAFGETLTESRLLQYEGEKYAALLVNIHETSTGQLYSAKMLGQFCKRNHMYYIIDAISSFLADELDMTAIGADVIITASQKALSLAPGMVYLALSERIQSERVRTSRVKSIYFDLNEYLDNMNRGQTPYTPAVGTILQLKRRLDIIAREGIEASVQHHKDLADYFRSECRNANIKIPDYPLSNSLTPILIESKNAYDIFLTLKDKEGLMVTPCGGELRNYVLRIGHLGNITKDDLKIVARKLQEVLE